MALVGGASLKSLRGSMVRSLRYLKRIRDEVKGLVDDGGFKGPDQPEAETVDQLQEKLEVLRQLSDEFRDLLSQFERKAAELDDETFEVEQEVWGDTDLECRSLIVKVQKILEPRPRGQADNPGVVVSPSAPSSSDSNLNENFNRLLNLLETQQQGSGTPASAVSTGVTQPSELFIQAKLPRLELPKFSGDLLKWKPFWDRFEASVDKNPKLASVDKLSYLISQLEKVPLMMVEALPVTNDNYLVAVEMLKTKYGDQRMVIAMLYRKLNEMRPVKNEPVALRRFVADIDCLLGSLGAMGQDTTDDNFATIILSKLPNPVVVQLELGKDVDVPWSVVEVRKRLTDYLTRIERAAKVSALNLGSDRDNFDFTGDSLLGGETHRGSMKKNKGGKNIKGQPKGKVNQGPGPKEFQQVQDPAKPWCAYCEGQHYSDQCEQFKTADERHEKLGERCANCLKLGHKKRDCKSNKPCFYCKRVKSHHSSLCFNKFGRNASEQAGLSASQPAVDSVESDPGDNGDDGENGLLASGEEVRLQTALVPVSDGRSSNFVSTRALFDPGCNRSYCSQDLAKKLGLKPSNGPTLQINRFGSSKPFQVQTKVSKVQVKTLDGTIRVIELSVIPKISGSLTRMPVSSDKLEKLKTRLVLADSIPEHRESGPVDLLIGNDYYLDFITGEKIEVCKGLYLLGSEFGYILTGRLQAKSRNWPSMSMCGFTGGTLDAIANIDPVPRTDPIQLKKPDPSDFWSLETIGIKDDPSESDDQKAIADFEKNVRFENSRYSVSLPWNDKVADLQSDFGLCIGRLNSLVRRIGEDSSLWDSYTQIMEDQLSKGVIEKVEEKNNNNPVHYIPHHAIVQPQRETTKVRVVYDGSAKTRHNKASLNESLFRGPIILEDLVGVLLRFRLKPIAITADIEKAFLQIGINEEDRDRVRFVWLKDPSLKKVEGNIEIYRFARVLFGLNCSPSLLAQVIQYHLKKKSTPVASAILDNLYVDNVFMGVNSLEDAQLFYRDSKQLFKEASMNLRCWASNSKYFTNLISEVDRVKSDKVKVLGVQWDTVDDKLNIGGPSVEKLVKAKTKREILSGLSSVFDPLGWYAPCSIESKCILQAIANDKKNWDSEVGTDMLEKWSSKIENLTGISEIKIPRQIVVEGKLVLVAFCDASSTSFATAVYLICDTGNSIYSNLVFAKSRLNPTKKLSIPRLELMGVLIGTRALKFVEAELRLPIETVVVFSDSQCVLSWVKSQKQLDVFVRNRLTEITTKRKGLRFRYVNTEQNPADWATRGKKPSELGEFWWHGPAWLLQPRSEWPTWEFPEFIPEQYEPKKKTVYETGMVSNEKPLAPLGLCEMRHSSLKKLHRITAWCLRFIRALKGEMSPDNGLTVNELVVAKITWEKFIQAKTYAVEIKAIAEGKRHPRMQLGLFVDEQGLLRCKGRMGNASIPWNAKFPKLLPANDNYAKLLVQDIHVRSGHVTVAHTLTLLRKEYWVPSGRALVKKVVGGCVVCRKAVGKPFTTPTAPELPSSRVTPHPSFEECAVDYFGPVKLKGPERTEKAWVCLFTCLSTRAVHLELVSDMTSTEFLMALRRFIARRGKPKTMLSDNGPQFTLVSNTVNEGWSTDLRNHDIQSFCTNGGISWKFITPYAPFTGGVYERLVGVVKECLRKTVGRALLTSQKFQTLLCECEAIVNSRPLTYVGSEASSGPVLTPAHFLSPAQSVVSPEPKLEDDSYTWYSPSAEELVKDWKKGQNLLEQFWTVWSTDYLNMLRERSRYDHRGGSRLGLKPRVGHVVLIKEARLPRGSWRMGKIVQVHESLDTQVRSATIRLPSGLELKRPVGLLVPLEFAPQVDENDSAGQVDGHRKEKPPDGKRTPGQEMKVVLAKVRGYPWWPGKILNSLAGTPLEKLKVPKNSVGVQFFQTERYAFVLEKDIAEFDHEKVKNSKNRQLQEAGRLAAEWLLNN